MKMADKVCTDVTLANADHTLLQCLDEKVSKGVECSLTLKHSKGRVTNILTSRSPRIPVPRSPKPAPHTPSGETLRKRGSKPKRLEALLSYKKRLVEQKGLPPSRLMLEQPAAAPASAPAGQSQETSTFKCELCEYITNSKHGLSDHKGLKHKIEQKSESSNLVTVDPEETSKRENGNDTVPNGDNTEKP